MIPPVWRIPLSSVLTRCFEYHVSRSSFIWYGVPFTGGVKLSSHAVGDNLKGYSAWSKPEFARQPIIRDSFFRSTGVMRGNPYATGGAM